MNPVTRAGRVAAGAVGRRPRTAAGASVPGWRRRPTAGRLIESVSTSLAIQGINVFTGILVARELGVRSRGELAAAILWPSMITSLGSLGMSDAISFHVSKKRDELRETVGAAVAIWAGQCLLLGAVGAALIPLALAHDGTVTVRASLVYLANTPAYLATAYGIAVLQGAGRLTYFQIVRLLVMVGTASGLGIAALVGGLTVGSAVLAYLGAYGLTAALATIGVLRESGAPRLDRSRVRSLLAYGVRSHTDSVSAIFNQRLDQLLISLFLAPVQLGLYVVGGTLSSLTSLVGSSIGLVAMPRIARTDDRLEQVAKTQAFLRVAIVSAVAITVPMIVATPLLIGILFGSKYAGAATVARILLAAAATYSVARVLATVLKALGRPLDAGIAEFTALGGTVLGLALLLPFFGLTGAAIASLIGYTASCVWMVRATGRSLELGPASLVFQRGRDDVRSPVERAGGAL